MERRRRRDDEGEDEDETRRHQPQGFIHVTGSAGVRAPVDGDVVVAGRERVSGIVGYAVRRRQHSIGGDEAAAAHLVAVRLGVVELVLVVGHAAKEADHKRVRELGGDLSADDALLKTPARARRRASRVLVLL